MKPRRQQILQLAASAAILSILLALTGRGAWSQTTRTIRIIVPYAPGGPTDYLARLLGDHISRAQRISVLVENRTGAGSVIGTDAAARSAPDGNTLLLYSKKR